MSSKSSYLLVNNQHWFHDYEGPDPLVCLEIDGCELVEDERVALSTPTKHVFPIRKDGPLGLFLISRLPPKGFSVPEFGFSLSVSESSGNVLLVLPAVISVRVTRETSSCGTSGVYVEIDNRTPELVKYVDDALQEL